MATGFLKMEFCLEPLINFGPGSLIIDLQEAVPGSFKTPFDWVSFYLLAA